MGQMRTNKIVDFSTMVTLRQRYREQGRIVVWTNGCFDLLHLGHIHSLQQASQLGEILLVGINSDTSVRHLKGPGRPILPETERARIVAALECVDHVLIFDETTPTAVLEQVQPDIHCKGTEYAPPHGRALPERAVVEAYGGRVAFLPLLPGLSTTDLIARVQHQRGKE